MATTNDAMFDKLKVLYPAYTTLGDLLYAFWEDQGRHMAGERQDEFYTSLGATGSSLGDKMNVWWSQAPEYHWTEAPDNLHSLMQEDNFLILQEDGFEILVREVSGFCMLQETGDRFLNEDAGQIKIEITSWAIRAENNSFLIAETGDNLRLQAANIGF